jgi:mannose-6-phosphate isomerase-like protein (cupin superfamily)
MTFSTFAGMALVLVLFTRIAPPQAEPIRSDAILSSTTSVRVTASGGEEEHGTAAVRFFSSDEVHESFRRGAVLFDDRGSFMIHTSRRNAPGKAEVHTRDTDIFYVQEGSATLVTGGIVADPAETEPDEIRGTAIIGGDIHVIRKGDVIIIPAGTPHWFKDVGGPVTYYTVKSR